MGKDISDLLKRPQKMAELFYEAVEDSFKRMSHEDFERWLKDELEKEYIVLGTSKMPVTKEYKGAMIHYVAFLYYSTTPNR